MVSNNLYWILGTGLIFSIFFYAAKPKLKDYKIPGISPRFYVPVFVSGIMVDMIVVPNWNIQNEEFFLAFILLYIFAVSAISNFCIRFGKHILHALKK